MERCIAKLAGMLRNLLSNFTVNWIKTQDGRPLRRYCRRWKIKRLFAWLQNFRRLVVRYEFHVENFLAMAQLGCIMILLRLIMR